MNRIVLGILLGLGASVVDVLLMLPMKFPDKPTALADAFFSRFAIGFIAANVTLPIHQVLAGALVGLLVSIPDAIITKSYVPIIVTGLIFGALAGPHVLGRHSSFKALFRHYRGTHSTVGGCTVRIMTGPPVLGRFAVLLPLVLCGLFGQPLQPRSEEDRAGEMKRRVVETLNLRPGDTAADVGCGDGFYTIPLARFLGPSGKVLAEDISDAELIKLKEHLGKEGLKNVEVIKGAEDDPKLPVDRLDAVLIVNAYHEMTAHDAILRHVRDALKPGGTFVLMEGIWDRRETQSRDEQVKHHQLAPQVAKQEVQRASFEIVEVRDPFLERAPDEDGKSRWWILIARKPLR